MEDDHIDSTEEFERALTNAKNEHFFLRLYITGNTPRSARAIATIREICEKHLKGRYQLEVIDIHQQPELARNQQIIAAPTLIKQLPLPLRRIIGDLSKTDRILVGLDIDSIEEERPELDNETDG